MQTILLILLAAGLVAVFAFLILLYKKIHALSAADDSVSFALLQQRMGELAQTFDAKLGETQRFLYDSHGTLGKTLVETRLAMQQTLNASQTDMHKTMQTQFGQSAKIIAEVTDRLAKIDETNKQVVGFASQLQSLERILKNPKQRGVLGEYYLETVLKNVLPPGSFKLQYAFANGDIVDAVIQVKDMIIPVDSKFSLENYNRAAEETDPDKRAVLEDVFRSDLKKRIDETSKYIKPSEGTSDFAFMFIPSEGIYYDLLVNKVGSLKVNTQALIEYAFRDKKVIIVSPTSFLAYLQTVLHGLRALAIEESAKEIRTRVGELGRHLAAYDEYFKKLGNNLATTVNSYNFASKELGKIDKDVVKIAGGERAIEPLTLDRPQID